MENGSVSLVSISYNSFAFTTRNTKQDATQYQNKYQTLMTEQKTMMSDMSLDIYDYLFNLYRPVQEHV